MSDSKILDSKNIVDIDFTSAAFKQNARDIIASWSKRAPFYVLTEGPTQVVVGRYKDVQEVFTDPVRFSSDVPRKKGFEQFDRLLGGQAIPQMDGEQHARLRRLLMPAFSARRLEQLEGRIREIVGSLLDDIDANGLRFDAMSQFASQLVIGVLLTAMLNLDKDQQSILLDFQEVQPIITATKPGQQYPGKVFEAHERTAELVKGIILDRRANPRSDFLSDLVLARDQGDKLSDQELFDNVLGILAALATTPRSAAGAIYAIFSHPDQLSELVADPSLIPDAIEECLRIAANGYFTFPRLATVDTEVGGTPIYRGMIVRASPLSANLDAEIYSEPLRFDIHRKPKRIMTFGAGPHHCLGNILGRRTICIAIELLLKRFPGARLADPEFKPTYGGSVGELRILSLPMITH